MPRLAASLNDLSPRPPTSNTTPILTALAADPDPLAGAVAAGAAGAGAAGAAGASLSFSALPWDWRLQPATLATSTLARTAARKAPVTTPEATPEATID